MKSRNMNSCCLFTSLFLIGTLSSKRKEQIIWINIALHFILPTCLKYQHWLNQSCVYGTGLFLWQSNVMILSYFPSVMLLMQKLHITHILYPISTCACLVLHFKRNATKNTSLWSKILSKTKNDTSISTVLHKHTPLLQMIAPCKRPGFIL